MRMMLKRDAIVTEKELEAMGLKYLGWTYAGSRVYGNSNNRGHDAEIYLREALEDKRFRVGFNYKDNTKSDMDRREKN